MNHLQKEDSDLIFEVLRFLRSVKRVVTWRVPDRTIDRQSVVIDYKLIYSKFYCNTSYRTIRPHE